MTGFELALEEITLVLFTSLAPAGAFAYFLMAVALVRAEEEERRTIARFLLVPILATLLGLVASATHLGNPENALYVLTRVGKSPLSTEVAAVVVFLGLAGVHWMYQFAEHRSQRLSCGLLVAAALAALGTIAAIAFAYASRTVVSWNTCFAPLSVAANAVVGGSLMMLAVLAWARKEKSTETFCRAVLAGCGIALAASAVIYLAQGQALRGWANAYTAASQLVPHYGWYVGLYSVLAAGGWLLDVMRLLRRLPSSRIATSAACLLSLAGIFVMRLSFYAMHLTVGM